MMYMFVCIYVYVGYMVLPFIILSLSETRVSYLEATAWLHWMAKPQGPSYLGLSSTVIDSPEI